jgi:superfamily I DNA/RNA helicase
VRTHSFYHEEALEADEAKQAFALLTLVADPTDRVALRYWLGVGSPTWNARGYKILRDHCEKSGASPWEALQSIVDGSLQLPHTRPLVDNFKELVTRLDQLKPLKTADLIEALFPQQQAWAEELRDLALGEGSEDLEIDALLDRLRKGITQPEIPAPGAHVRVMSLHKSKGLTSKVVIVSGCMQGLIPNLSTKETPKEQEIHDQEQRRLFYVAITRCTEILVLSSVNHLDRKLAYQLGVQVFDTSGQFAAAIASNFLDELGPSAPTRLRGTDFLHRLSRHSTTA